MEKKENEEKGLREKKEKRKKQGIMLGGKEEVIKNHSVIDCYLHIKPKIPQFFLTKF